MNELTNSRQIPNSAGDINERLLRRFGETNLGRIESAHRNVETKLYSPEAKRSYMRMYYPMQVNVHYINSIARMRLPAEDVEKAEADLQKMVKTVEKTIDTGMVKLEKRLTTAGIDQLAEYHVPPVEKKSMVFSPLGATYLEIIKRFDQLMLMIETLTLYAVIDFTEAARLKVEYKKPIRSIAQAARLTRNRLYRLAQDAGNSMDAEGHDDDDMHDGPSASGADLPEHSGSDAGTQADADALGDHDRSDSAPVGEPVAEPQSDI